MSSTTATVFIGKAHPNHGGINASHLIKLTENSTPALILQDIDGREKRKIFYPTLENTIDDIFLMIAVYILKEVKLPAKLKNSESISLYDDFNQNERLELYKKALQAFEKNNVKVVINILTGSHLLGRIDQIKKYPNDFEVTVPSLRQEYSGWSG